MKKLLTILLAAILFLSACSGTPASNKPEDKNKEGQESTTNETKSNTKAPENDPEAQKKEAENEKKKEEIKENIIAKIETDDYTAEISEIKKDKDLLVIPIHYKPKSDSTDWMVKLKIEAKQNGKVLEMDQDYDFGPGAIDPKDPILYYAFKNADDSEIEINLDGKTTKIELKK